MLIDDITIKVMAGNGGKGAATFNKNMMELGPTGGSGGKGASIYLQGVANIEKLGQFRHKKKIQAPHGKDGRSQFRDGHDGKDVILHVPVGTIVRNTETKKEREVLHIGEQLLLVQGGIGGRGNFHFRSSKNTTPKKAGQGRPGEERTFQLELKLIADVGLIGLPNVGKSSLLNELTNAKSKVANYQFTTLEPNLGVYYELILADIPGLIEGAHQGKGLGAKFLRHIERTNILFHLVSAESEDPIADYKTIRKELEKHSPKLSKKKEYLFLSKCDEKEPEEIKKIIQKLKKEKLTATPISILNETTLKEIRKTLNKIKDKK